MEQAIVSHKVYILPQAGKEIDRLPGHMRQRIRRAVLGLQSDPRPPHGTQLDCDLAPGREVWRLRFDAWRVAYLIDHNWGGVYVLAVRKRPPYQYEDLSLLIDVD